MTEVEILSFDGAHTVARWRNLVVQIYDGPLAPDAFAAAVRTTLGAFRAVRAAVGPAGIVLGTVVVSPRSAIPDAATRKIASELPAWFDYVVVICEGDDLRAALIRSVIVGLDLLARTPGKRRGIGRDVPSGARALASRSGGSMTEHEIVALIEALRARMRSREATRP